MSHPHLPAIVKTLTQIHDVENVIVHPDSHDAVTHHVLVFTEDATIEANICSVKDLEELAEIVETHTTSALVDKKVKLKYRITL